MEAFDENGGPNSPCYANLEDRISDALLDFAALFVQVNTSDLQGLAVVEARKLIALVLMESGTP